MRNNATYKLTRVSMFAAIIAAMTFIPYVGYIVYGGISITTLHIPVFIGAVLFGPAAGAVLGAVWGVTCLLYALMNGTVEAAIFLNPLISVLPRIAAGYAAGWYYVLFNRLAKKRAAISLPVAAAFSTITHTALVLGAIALFGQSGMALVSFSDWILNVYAVAVGLNCVVELAAAVIIVTAVCLALFKVYKPEGAKAKA